MSPTRATSVPCLYAIKLIVAEHPGDDRLVGRVEHVLSGRCREFHSGAALLACLAQEQSLIGRTDGAAAAGASAASAESR